MRLSLLATVSVVLLASPALAQSHGRHKHEVPSRQEQPHGSEGARAGSEQSPEHGHDHVETQYIFGFTEGSGIHAPGETDLKLDSIGSFGNRGTYTHVGQKLEIHTGLPGNINIAFGLLGDFHRIRNVPEIANVGPRYVVSGGSFELRWRLLDREKAPVGLTLLAEPSFSFIDETSAERGRGRALETRLLFDRELVPDKLFAAFNVIYETEKFRPRGLRLFSDEGEELDTPLTPCFARAPNTADEAKEPCTAFARHKSAEHSSNFGVSGALAFQAFPNVFLGAEVRYLRAYEGLTLQRFRGEAVFVGPTLFTRLGERLALSASFTTQVAGHAVGVPGRLDLNNFSRHQARLRLIYEF